MGLRLNQELRGCFEGHCVGLHVLGRLLEQRDTLGFGCFGLAIRCEVGLGRRCHVRLRDTGFFPAATEAFILSSLRMRQQNWWLLPA